MTPAELQDRLAEVDRLIIAEIRRGATLPEMRDLRRRRRKIVCALRDARGAYQKRPVKVSR